MGQSPVFLASDLPLRGKFRLHSPHLPGLADKTLCVLRVGAFSPLRTFRGHTDEVNRVAWSPAPPNWSATSNLPSPAPLVATGGRVLASCSDDMTVRIWSCDAEPAPGSDDGGFQNGRLEKYCKGVLRGHEKEIYTMGFSPSTVGSSSSVPLLATYVSIPPSRSPDDIGSPCLSFFCFSASFDYTVRLWDLSALTCLRVLRAHTETVFSISFSPTGRHLASAGWDKLMVVWEVEVRSCPTAPCLLRLPLQTSLTQLVLHLFPRTNDSLVSPSAIAQAKPASLRSSGARTLGRE